MTQLTQFARREHRRPPGKPGPAAIERSGGTHRRRRQYQPANRRAAQALGRGDDIAPAVTARMPVMDFVHAGRLRPAVDPGHDRGCEIVYEDPRYAGLRIARNRRIAAAHRIEQGGKLAIARSINRRRAQHE